MSDKNKVVSFNKNEKLLKSGLTSVELVAIQYCFERQARAMQEMQLAQVQTKEVLEQLGIEVTNEMQIKLVGNDLVLI